MQDKNKNKQAESTESLQSIREVCEYLARSGWKIKKSSAYKHRSEGKLRPSADGTFSARAVDKYATEWLTRVDGAAASNNLEKIQEEKALAELDKLKAQARHWDTRTKIETGQYVPRENWIKELAARATVIKSDMKNFIYQAAPEIIRLVEGNVEKAPDLIDFYLRHLEQWVDRYAREKAWPVVECDADGVIQ